MPRNKLKRKEKLTNSKLSECPRKNISFEKPLPISGILL